MSNALAAGYQGVGLSTIAQEMSPEREAERSTARATKARKDRELESINATQPSIDDYDNQRQAQSLQLENAVAEQERIKSAGQQQFSFQQMERYDNDSFDPRHLNTMFTNLAEQGSEMYGDISRVDTVTEQDKDLLDRNGSRVNEELLNDPEFAGSFVVATMKNGDKELRSVDYLKGVTGYNDYATSKELARQTRTQELAMLKSIGLVANDTSREAFRHAMANLPPGTDPKSPEFQEEYSKLYHAATASKGRSGSGRPENLTEKEAEAKRRTQLAGHIPGTAEYEQAFSDNMSAVNKEYSRPSAVRGQEFANDARAELDAMDFFDTAGTEWSLKERAAIEPKIAMIEQAGGADFSSAEKVTLERINKLTMLGDKGGELTDEQTGLIDNVFRTVKKYISDNTEGVESEAAYAAYRNVVRHALYGSVLTPGETRSFTAQFGSMGQQRGPILAQLKSSLEEVASDYQTLIDTNDPYVMFYRTGKTAEELDRSISAITERIDMIESVRSGEVIKMSQPGNTPAQSTIRTGSVPLSDEKRARMDAIRYGTTPPATTEGTQQ